jgi:hypothetical protein
MKGEKGESVPGVPGTNGSDGLDGRKGPSGPPGDRGDKGEKGAIGLTGLRGKVGPKGYAGTNGTNGMDGIPGTDGDPGFKGEKGLVGEKGDTGPEGDTVLINGTKGDKGPKGPIGDLGDIGDMGPMGDKGEKGDNGTVGDKGVQGVMGDKGDKGLVGDRGPNGTKGELGITGDVGDKGPQGDMGMQGPNGTKGMKGFPGDDGFKGAKGDMGEKGDNGTHGKKGNMGDQGPDGRAGNIGDNGKKGCRGCSLAKIMVSPAQMQDPNGDGEGDESRPQIGSVGFVISTRSLCVYTPLGWIDVESGDKLVKREAVPRSRRDIVPLTRDNVQKYRRHLVPLMPLLKSLDGSLSLPEPECGNGILEEGEECDGKDLRDATCPQHHGNMYIGSPWCSTSCQLDMSNCQPLALLVFALSSDVDGMMASKDSGVLETINGTSRANLLCQKDAQRSGLWGHYSALLTTKQLPLQNITAEKFRHLPIVNTMGHVVATKWEDLVKWRLRDDAPLLTLEGDDVRKGQRRGVWHGGVSAHGDCLSWSSSSRTVFGRAFSTSSTGRLVEATVSCDSHMAILCALTAP